MPSPHPPAFALHAPCRNSALPHPVLRCSSFAPTLPVSFRLRAAAPLRHRPRTPRAPCACSTPSTSNLSLDELQSSVTAAAADASAAVRDAPDLKQLDDLRVRYLGKKGSITAVMKSVGKLARDDRPKLGAIVNKVKTELSDLITARKQALLEAKRAADADKEEHIDTRLPPILPRPQSGRVHPITSTIEIATDIFIKLGYDLIDETSSYNREVEEDYYCFEALNCPPDHPARDMQDTFYLTKDKKVLMRTQTSAVQIRYMEENKPPFRIIAPGRVFRRDTVDATHYPIFHQIEILAVEKMGVLNLGSLRATIIHFLKKMLGDDIETRFRGSYFPFTEPSMEVDVFFRGKWLEVLGCGMVDPDVLTRVGIDPDEWCGFAAGFGVERFAMVMHEITDIRELYKNDLRFLMQGMPSVEPEREFLQVGLDDSGVFDPDDGDWDVGSGIFVGMDQSDDEEDEQKGLES